MSDKLFDYMDSIDYVLDEQQIQELMDKDPKIEHDKFGDSYVHKYTFTDGTVARTVGSINNGSIVTEIYVPSYVEGQRWVRKIQTFMTAKRNQFSTLLYRRAGEIPEFKGYSFVREVSNGEYIEDEIWLDIMNDERGIDVYTHHNKVLRECLKELRIKV